jgi:hypothetical protein
MYMNWYGLGKCSIDSAKNVGIYFSMCSEGTASEIGASGKFMTSLVNRNIARVVGEREGFVQICDDLYRRTTCKVYALNLGGAEFWTLFCRSVESEANNKKYTAEGHIKEAQRRLAEAQELLDSIK